MIRRRIDNRLYPILIMITVLVFFGLVVVGGCKTFNGETVQVENNIKINTASEEVISEVKNISVEEVYKIVSGNQDYLILDVRTPDEFNEGHIEGAVLIPVSELESRLDELAENKPIVVYCKVGGRSSTAANILVENGFTGIYDMTGGIMDWIENGYSVIVEIEAAEKAEILLVSVDEAYEFFKSGGYIFLDVRTQDEYNSGHIQGAINIPVDELEDRLDELLNDMPIIAYCSGTGCSRSGVAAQVLTDNGFVQVYDMIGGGITEWGDRGYPMEE